LIRTARRWRVRGLLIYCSDYHCSHSIGISAEQWPDHVRLSDLEARFVCRACGKRGDGAPLPVILTSQEEHAY